MTTTAARDAYVAARFDALEARFKAAVPADDDRLAALLRALGPVAGMLVLDLGCGKGRFARRLAERGARVVALDASAGMLAHAEGLDRVRAGARRLPLASGAFDAVVAVEVLQHIKAPAAVLAEAFRVLRPGGRLAIVDRNARALDARRPWLPALAVKGLDRRRGRWMYPPGAPVRERWFWPGRLRGELRARGFVAVTVEFVLLPDEARRALFRRVPCARRMALWTARRPGGGDE